MRRLIPTLLAAVLPLSLLAFAPSLDGEASDSGEAEASSEESPSEEPTTFTPAPVDFTFHLHGDPTVAGTDDDYAGQLGAGPLTMDLVPGDAGESRQLLNYVGGPNTECTGNSLFPTWSGYIGEGTVVSDGKLTLDVAAGLGGTVNVAIWADVTGQNCNDAFIQPDVLAQGTLPVGPGLLEVDLPMADLDPDFSILLMVYPETSDPTAQGRINYDDGIATLNFTCQPDDVDTAEEAETADCLPF